MLWGGRKRGQAHLVAASYEVSSATDLCVVLAEMNVGWDREWDVMHTTPRSLNVDFWGVCA